MSYAFNDDKSKYDLENILKNIATIEESPALYDHEPGDVILYNDELYLVRDFIDAGDTYTEVEIGTSTGNVEKIVVGDLLSRQEYIDGPLSSPSQIKKAGVFYTSSISGDLAALLPWTNFEDVHVIAFDVNTSYAEKETDGMSYGNILITSPRSPYIFKARASSGVWTDVSASVPLRSISNLSSANQFNGPGMYRIGSCSNIHSQFTDYATGDFWALALGSLPNFGTIIMTSPRFVTAMWVLRIWNGSFVGAWKIGN